jgi:hypothetical protein
MALNVPFSLVIIVGIIVFFALIVTATLGFLLMKGKGGISFGMHVNLARLTIVLALIHGFLAMAFYFGL